MASLYRLPGGGEVSGLGCSIEDFNLADGVGFLLGLSVQSLDGRCTERDSRNDSQHDLVLCIHDASSLFVEPDHQVARWKLARSRNLEMKTMIDREKNPVSRARADGTMAARWPERKLGTFRFQGSLKRTLYDASRVR